MLTPKAIAEAPDFQNALHKRELLLRDHGVTELTCLESTRNVYDAIDLTGNMITRLHGLPLLDRLEGLLLGNNNVETIDVDIGKNLPNLRWLSLDDNRLSKLSDLEFLESLKRLEHLSLAGNPVSELPEYRLWVIGKQPRIRFLDFQRVTDAERRTARDKYIKEITSR